MCSCHNILVCHFKGSLGSLTSGTISALCNKFVTRLALESGDSHGSAGRLEFQPIEGQSEEPCTETTNRQHFVLAPAAQSTASVFRGERPLVAYRHRNEINVCLGSDEFQLPLTTGRSLARTVSIIPRSRADSDGRRASSPCECTTPDPAPPGGAPPRRRRSLRALRQDLPARSPVHRSCSRWRNRARAEAWHRARGAGYPGATDLCCGGAALPWLPRTTCLTLRSATGSRGHCSPPP